MNLISLAKVPTLDIPVRRPVDRRISDESGSGQAHRTKCTGTPRPIDRALQNSRSVGHDRRRGDESTWDRGEFLSTSPSGTRPARADPSHGPHPTDEEREHRSGVLRRGGSTVSERPIVYRIVRWNDTFENAGSRKVDDLSWFSQPNRHDGAGYRRLIGRKDGMQLYAAWELTIQVVSRLGKRLRGYVVNDQGRPLDAEDLAVRTGAPQAAFVRAFEVLTGPKIGWLEVVHSEHAGSTSGQTGSTLPERPDEMALQGRTGQGRTGQCGVLTDVGGEGGDFHVDPDVLGDTDKLLALFGQYAERGIVADCEADRLDFVACAESVLRIENGNPAGLFAERLRNWPKRRGWVSHADEENAARRLRTMNAE